MEPWAWVAIGGGVVQLANLYFFGAILNLVRTHIEEGHR